MWGFGEPPPTTQGRSVELIAQCRQAPGRRCAMLIALGWLPEVGGGGFHGTSLPAVSRFQTSQWVTIFTTHARGRGPELGSAIPPCLRPCGRSYPGSCQKVKSPGKLRWARQEPPTHQMTNASAGRFSCWCPEVHSIGKAGCRASTNQVPRTTHRPRLLCTLYEQARTVSPSTSQLHPAWVLRA